MAVFPGQCSVQPHWSNEEVRKTKEDRRKSGRPRKSGGSQEDLGSQEEVRKTKEAREKSGRTRKT